MCPLSAELGASKTAKLTLRASVTVTVATERVAAAKLALEEGEKYQLELDALSLIVALKYPIPRFVADGLMPSAY